MSSVSFSESESGWVWAWSDATAHRQIEFVVARQLWLSWQRVDGGGWTSQPMASWPVPAGRDEADRMVRAYLAEKETQR